MAVTAAKTFVAGEVLTASDLNAEFTNVYSNGETLGWPATVAKDFDGNSITLDSDADSSLTADTDDRLDLALSGTDLFRWDGTVSTPVNGIDFVAAATGVAPKVRPYSGTDTNVNLNLVGLGTGHVQVHGRPIDDISRRAANAAVAARTSRHRASHIEANHIGEAQSLGF